MKPLLIFLTVIFLMFGKNAISQVTFDAWIENPVVNGTDISFDVMLRGTNASSPLYLGNADFVLFYNAANFTAPTFEFDDGTTIFTNSNGTQTSSYNDNIVTDPSFLPSGQLVINILQPAFGNQTQFNARIARIDTVAGGYRLGTFTITGISNPAGTLDLVWKIMPPGVSSNVQTLTNTDPWFSSAATGNYINPGPIYLGPDDVSISSIVAPLSGQIVNANGSDVSAYLKNVGSSPVSNVDVYYNLNGGTEVGPVVVAGPLAPGDSVLVTFTGANELTSMNDQTGVVRVFADLTGDANVNNDTGTVSNVFLRIPPSSFPYFSDFSEVPSPYTLSGSANLWAISPATNPGGTSSDPAARANFWSVSSGSQILRSTLIDLTGTTNPLLSFYRAYTTYAFDPGDDELQVVVSTDGGLTWSASLYANSWFTVPSLGTLPSQDPSYVPTAAGQWRHNLVDLSAYAGQEIVVGFNAISDWGNNLWIDNIAVSDASNISLIPVNAPGTYGDIMTNRIQVSFTALRPGLGNGSSITQTDNLELWTPEYTETSVLQHSLKRETQIERDPSVGSRVTTSGISHDASEGVLALSRVDAFPVNSTYATNTTATTFNGNIFTPDVVADRYWEVAFSGDDHVSTATYDVILDISNQLGIVDPDRLYIMKRVDQNSPWVCLNTITDYEMGLPVRLIATGLQGFSQFGIGAEDGTLPVSIISFNALSERNNVTLAWTTEWEENNDRFEVQRRITGTEDWSVAGSVTGSGSITTPKDYTYTDRNLITGMYEYRLISIDFDGNVMADNSPVTQVEVGVPMNFDLAQNYPNPFNPITKIGYEIPVEGLVKLIVYDISGREVATLVNEVKTPGFYLTEFNGSNLSSGVYFYRLVTSQSVITKRLVLLK